MEERNMDMKIVGITVAILVSITVLAGVLMPVLDDATATTDTFTNEGYFYMDKIASSDSTEHIITWSSSSASTLVVDGKNIDVSNWGLSSFASVTIFATETDLFRLGLGSGGLSVSWVQLRGATINYAQATTSFDATISEGTVSIQLDSEASARSLTYNEAYMIKADTGEYVMKKANESTYMTSDSTIYSLGYTSLSNGSGNDGVVFKITGDVEGVEVSVARQSTANTITISDLEIHKESVSGHEDLYLFDKITFTATELDTPNDCVYSYVIVPHEVTAERSVHFTDNQNALLAVIPMLVIVALLIGVVALVIRSRLD